MFGKGIAPAQELAQPACESGLHGNSRPAATVPGLLSFGFGKNRKHKVLQLSLYEHTQADRQN